MQGVLRSSEIHTHDTCRDIGTYAYVNIQGLPGLGAVGGLERSSRCSQGVERTASPEESSCGRWSDGRRSPAGEKGAVDLHADQGPVTEGGVSLHHP